jgi:hypothetical protein
MMNVLFKHVFPVVSEPSYLLLHGEVRWIYNVSGLSDHSAQLCFIFTCYLCDYQFVQILAKTIIKFVINNQ